MSRILHMSQHSDGYILQYILHCRSSVFDLFRARLHSHVLIYKYQTISKAHTLDCRELFNCTWSLITTYSSETFYLFRVLIYI